MTVYEVHCDFLSNSEPTLFFISNHYSIGFYSSREKAERALQEYNPIHFVTDVLRLVHHLDEVEIFERKELSTSEYRCYSIKTYLIEEYILNLNVIEHPLDPLPWEQPWTH